MCYCVCVYAEGTNLASLWHVAAAKSLQSCSTLCEPIDGSPPGSPVPEILQTRTLEWVAISFSNAWKWKLKVKVLSHVQLLATPWSAAHQAPPSMGFSRQEYWSGVPLSPPLEQWVDANNWDRIRFGIRVVSLLWGYVGFEVPDNYLGESVTQSCLTFGYPMDCSPPGSSVEFSWQEYWSGLPFPSPGIFLTQRLNPGLLHCRWILYRLSHQGFVTYSYP